jgi:hypothetical protein
MPAHRDLTVALVDARDQMGNTRQLKPRVATCGSDINPSAVRLRFGTVLRIETHSPPPDSRAMLTPLIRCKVSANFLLGNLPTSSAARTSITVWGPATASDMTVAINVELLVLMDRFVDSDFVQTNMGPI